MIDCFGDLHVHIGRDSHGRPVKITAATSLTLENALREAATRKGLDLLGIIDCGSVGVLKDLHALLDRGELRELAGGGFRYRDLAFIPGVEVETTEPGGGRPHILAYLPDLASLTGFVDVYRRSVTNPQLSTQRSRLSADELCALAERLGGIAIPAHIFTPHRSAYATVRRLPQLLGAFAASPGEPSPVVPAVELGLSADTEMAEHIGELRDYSFVTNSDAHSLEKIGREYTCYTLREASYGGWVEALLQSGKSGIRANFGLDPRLGKYHRTACDGCGFVAEDAPPVVACPRCREGRLTLGVLDRLALLADGPGAGGRDADGRPPYVHQVPLEFVPGIGRLQRERLIEVFGSEMNVLHRATFEELARVVGEPKARAIDEARHGRLGVAAGGGGRYGRLTSG